MATEQIAQRLDQLISMGDHVLGTHYKTEYYDHLVKQDVFAEWRAGALSFLDKVFGRDSTHFTEFQERCKREHHADAVEGQAILKAAKADVDGGFLRRLDDLVSADVFSNFLEIAQHLHAQGYKDPAASLTGAVLEDGLRKIARAHGITLKTKEDISSLSQKLAAAKTYNRLTQKEIEVWNEVRNNADHGKFDEYDNQAVESMLVGVRGFLAQHM